MRLVTFRADGAAPAVGELAGDAVHTLVAPSMITSSLGAMTTAVTAISSVP